STDLRGLRTPSLAQRGFTHPRSFPPPSGSATKPLVFGVRRRHRMSSDTVIAFRIPAIS
ncbi:hypothetical protein U1Q18_003520, partial [Sarracenia purpurea var. burkii]